MRASFRASPSSPGSRESSDGYTAIKKCAVAEANINMSRAMELIVMAGFPINSFDRRGGDISPLVAFSVALRPVFAPFLPKSHIIGGKYLDDFFLHVRSNFRDSLQASLKEGYGTIVFDGWEDVNSSPVVNVLLQTESTVNTGRMTYFLKTLYPGYNTMTAADYK